MEQERLMLATGLLGTVYGKELREGSALAGAEEIQSMIENDGNLEDYWFQLDVCLSNVTIQIWMSICNNLKPIVEDRDFFCQRIAEEMKSTLPTETIRAYLFNPGESLFIPDGLIETWRKTPTAKRVESILVKIWLFTALTKTAAQFVDKTNTEKGRIQSTLSLRLDLVMNHLKVDEAARPYLIAEIVKILQQR